MFMAIKQIWIFWFVDTSSEISFQKAAFAAMIFGLNVAMIRYLESYNNEKELIIISVILVSYDIWLCFASTVSDF